MASSTLKPVCLGARFGLLTLLTAGAVGCVAGCDTAGDVDVETVPTLDTIVDKPAQFVGEHVFVTGDSFSFVRRAAL